MDFFFFSPVEFWTDWLSKEKWECHIIPFVLSHMNHIRVDVEPALINVVLYVGQRWP